VVVVPWVVVVVGRVVVVGLCVVGGAAVIAGWCGAIVVGAVDVPGAAVVAEEATDVVVALAVAAGLAVELVDAPLAAVVASVEVPEVEPVEVFAPVEPQAAASRISPTASATRRQRVWSSGFTDMGGPFGAGHIRDPLARRVRRRIHIGSPAGFAQRAFWRRSGSTPDRLTGPAAPCRLTSSRAEEETTMAIDLPEAHARALAATGGIVAGVGAEQWGASSVCEGWSVRELVNHLVAGNWWVAPLVEGQTIDEVGDRFDGDVLGDDPSAAYQASETPAAAAFRAAGAMEAPVAVSYGPVPGEIYCGHRFLDVLVHGWDVAASTDQPTALDPELVAMALEVVEPQIEMLAASGMFGTRTEAPAGSSEEQRLLAMLGRT
jgi:uncharacterized protein (TIGR03086 family)